MKLSTLIKRLNRRSATGSAGKVGGNSVQPVVPSASPVPPGAVVKDFYEVVPGYGYVAICIDSAGRGLYTVIEPMLIGDEPELLVEIKSRLMDEIVLDERVFRESKRAVQMIKSTVERIARDLGCNDRYKLNKITYYVVRDTVGLGPIEVPYRDAKVEDIVCDGVGIPVYVFHRDFEWLRTNIVFTDEEDLNRFIRRLALRAGHDISIANPIVEGPLPPEGYRAHLTLGVVSRRGSTFTIRRFTAEPFTLAELIKLGTLDAEIAAYFWLLMDEIISMLICGAMASGKTTLLNAVAMTIRSESKIVTIEETPEIRLPHENWVPMVVRPSFEAGVKEIGLYDLLKSALRQRPDYIIVGEIRGEEAYTFFQAVAVGHGGLGTVHGESIESVIRRLESPPMNVPRIMIPLVKVFTLMGRVRTPRGIARKVLEVQEVVGVHEETQQVVLNKVYAWDSIKNTWIKAGRSYVLDLIAKRTARPLSEIQEELEKRKVVLEWMAEKGITRFSDFVKILNAYRNNPDKVYRTAEVELVVKKAPE